MLLSNDDKSNNESKEILNYILINYSEDLRITYQEKEDLLNILDSKISFILKNNIWLVN